MSEWLDFIQQNENPNNRASMPQQQTKNAAAVSKLFALSMVVAKFGGGRGGNINRMAIMGC